MYTRKHNRPVGSRVGRRPAARLPPSRKLLLLLRRCGVLALALLAVLGYSVGGALLRPGNDTVAQRLAEWGRDHHLNWAVTRLEQTQYALNTPATGGTLSGGIPLVAGHKPAGRAAPAAPHSAAPAPLTPFVTTPAPGEGQWQDVVFHNGLPAVRMTYLRPDDGHSSYLAAVMWLDPKLLTGRLHEGITDPGGSWNTPNRITGSLASTVAAAMPGGFRTNSGPVGNRGGYYDQGRAAEPLRVGAASLVISSDGTVSVGQWGRDVSINPAVRSVRQNPGPARRRRHRQPDLFQRQHPGMGLRRWEQLLRPPNRHRSARRRGTGVHQQPGHLGLLFGTAAGPGRCGTRHGARHQPGLEHRLLLHPRRGHRACPRHPRQSEQRPRALLFGAEPRLRRLLPAVTIAQPCR